MIDDPTPPPPPKPAEDATPPEPDPAQPRRQAESVSEPGIPVAQLQPETEPQPSPEPQPQPAPVAAALPPPPPPPPTPPGPPSASSAPTPPTPPSAPPPPSPSRREPPPKRESSRSMLFVIAGLLGLALIAIAYFGSAPKPPLVATRAIGARLDLASGDVTVEETGASDPAKNKSQKAISGTPLAVASRVKTAAGARALIRTSDGASVFLRGDSELLLQEKGFTLERGEAWLDAPVGEGEAIACNLGKHVVSASSAGLSIKRSGDDVDVYVARGLAILTSPGGRVEINAGEQGTAKGTDAPKLGPVAFWQDWTGGMGDSRPSHGTVGSGSGRIYGIDPFGPAGAPARKLNIARQTVRSVIRDGLAETEVDQTFGNPGGRAIEGWYWFTVPAEAIVTSFALETNGELVEGEVVEKHEAAAVYGAAVASANDPALLEWIDGRSYRARIFPIPANGTRRVVLRYMEVLPVVEGKLRYVYPMRSTDPVRYDELALSVDLGKAWEGRTVATSLDATFDDATGVVAMRRSGYVPRADFQVEIGAPKTKPLRAWRFPGGADQADYLMVRYVPEVAFDKLAPSKGEVVVVVDTSAGGDEASKQLRNAAAEGILRSLADGDRFALVALDVTPTVVYPEKGLAAATEGDISKALEKLAEHSVGGATDLGSMFEPALERLHGGEQPAIVYVGDGITTSGETTAEALMERLRRSISGSRARFFTVGTGPDARHELLAQLSRVGGGRHFRVDEADQTTEQALRLTSAIKMPTVTDLELDLGAGLDQPFYSATGKLARGEELVLYARTHHKLPEKVHVKGRVGGQSFDTAYDLEVLESGVAPMAPRLWANEYARRLAGSGSADEVRSKVLDLGLEYGLVTPFSSIIALDSESSFARWGIQRRSSKLRGVKLSTIAASDFGPSASSNRGSLGRLLLGPGGATWGCSKSADEASATSSSEPLQDNKKSDNSGGSGTRHRGAEGMMGSPSPIAPAGAPMAAASSRATPPGIPLATGATAADDLKEAAEKDKGGEESTAERRLGIDGDFADVAKAKKKTPMADEPTASQNAATTAPTATAKPVAIPKPESGLTAGAGGKPAEPGVIDQPIRVVPRPPPPPRPIRPLQRCSDVASRPLAERIVLWRRRLAQANSAADLITQYEAARAACELPDFRDQAALLQLVQAKIATEDTAERVLAHFAGEPESQQYLARAILRRTVDVRLAAAVSRVLYGGVDWLDLDRRILEKEKIDDKLQLVRAAMLVAPGDPAGDLRLIRLLAKKGERQEALAYGRRLRDRGLMTPLLATQLGDVLADAGEKDEALRTYSEIVEFDGDNPASRRALGDVFLRQGWYAAAYRQYKTLTDLEPKSQYSWLRLAASAAGSGRVDEALRVEREVISGEGTPGPKDPRQWARLWSASRLGVLLNDPTAAGGEAAKAGIGRKLKELSLFSGTGTLALLTWEDLDARLVLASATEAGKQESLLGEVTDAGPTGLYSVLASSEAWAKTSWVARWQADAPMGRTVKARLVTITWDGKAFSVSVKPIEIKAEAKSVGI
jgi:tetratricopeptide (TPR) repeat protein